MGRGKSIGSYSSSPMIKRVFFDNCERSRDMVSRDVENKRTAILNGPTKDIPMFIWLFKARNTPSRVKIVCHVL